MIHFVGAGSGAPDLITVRGKKYLEEADVCLLGPHLKTMEERIKEMAREDYDVPVQCIPSEIYGALDGLGALQLALNMAEEEKR